LYYYNKVLNTKIMSELNSEHVVSVSARGQATIPKEFREELGIDAPGRVKFVRTEEGDIVVRPIKSGTDLRGVLSGRTDEAGQTATERLRTGRERDAAAEAALRRRAEDEDST
jgi:AbrB family looped-hinge helix DNA binding protein